MLCGKGFPAELNIAPNSTQRLEQQLPGGSTRAGVLCLSTAHEVKSSELGMPWTSMIVRIYLTRLFRLHPCSHPRLIGS